MAKKRRVGKASKAAVKVNRLHLVKGKKSQLGGVTVRVTRKALVIEVPLTQPGLTTLYQKAAE